LQLQPPLELISAAEAQGRRQTKTHFDDLIFLKSEMQAEGKSQATLRSDKQDFSFSLLYPFLTATSFSTRLFLRVKDILLA